MTHLSGAGCTRGSSTELCKDIASSRTSGDRFMRRSDSFSWISPLPPLISIIMPTLQGSSTVPCTLLFSSPPCAASTRQSVSSYVHLVSYMMIEYLIYSQTVVYHN